MDPIVLADMISKTKKRTSANEILALARPRADMSPLFFVLDDSDPNDTSPSWSNIPFNQLRLPIPSQPKPTTQSRKTTKKNNDTRQQPQGYSRRPQRRAQRRRRHAPPPRRRTRLVHLRAQRIPRAPTGIPPRWRAADVPNAPGRRGAARAGRAQRRLAARVRILRSSAAAACPCLGRTAAEDLVAGESDWPW